METRTESLLDVLAVVVGYEAKACNADCRALRDRDLVDVYRRMSMPYLSSRYRPNL
jgi:hypothetical protein